MDNKITAYFGADVSEVEAKMLQAQRATKAYERALKGLGESQPINGVNAGLTKSIGNVKALVGALGQAGAAAGLVPGLGIAGVGVAAVVAGVNKLRDYYEEAAKFTEKILENSEKISATLKERGRIGLSPLEAEKAALMELQDKYAAIQKTRELQFKGHNNATITKTRDLTNDEAIQLSDIEVEIEQTKTRIAKLDNEAATKRSEENIKQAQDLQKRADDERKKDIDALITAQKKADFERKTDEEKIEFLESQNKLLKEGAQTNVNAQLHLLQNEEKLAALRLKVSSEKKKKDDEERDRVKEIEDLKFQRTWKFASDQQKLYHIIKEGRKAQAAYDKEKTTENLLNLEKLRAKYIELMDLFNGKGGKGDDGSRVLRGVKTSAEDAARADKEKARVEKLGQEKSEITGEVGSTKKAKEKTEFEKAAESARDKLNRDEKRSQILERDKMNNEVNSRTDNLLSKIEGYLRPTNIG